MSRKAIVDCDYIFVLILLVNSQCGQHLFRTQFAQIPFAIMDWGHYAGQVLLREAAVKVKYLPILLSASLLSIMMMISIFLSKSYEESKDDTII